MIKDLPKTVPPSVLATAERALVDGQRLDEGRKEALNARAIHLALARIELATDKAELDRMADAVFAWGVGLRKLLPSEALSKRFRRERASGPSISVIHEEIALEANGNARAGKLATELELNLSPGDEWLFRRYDRFDGYLASGGDQLNTVSSILIELHPKMLRAIHERIAEGAVWTRVEFGLKKLVEDHRERIAMERHDRRW